MEELIEKRDNRWMCFWYIFLGFQLGGFSVQQSENKHGIPGCFAWGSLTEVCSGWVLRESVQFNWWRTCGVEVWELAVSWRGEGGGGGHGRGNCGGGVCWKKPAGSKVKGGHTWINVSSVSSEAGPVELLWYASNMPFWNCFSFV